MPGIDFSKARNIIKAIGFAMREAIIELGQVTMQMALIAMLINTVHTALESAEI